MTVSEAIAARRSVRVYRGKPVEEEKLLRVIEAARLAPSARNIQECRYVAVTDRAMREKLMKAAANQSFVAEAPVVIVACATVTQYTMRCGQLAYPVDAAIAVDHMTLQAVEEGLGTCWICAFSEAEVKALLGIPEAVRVVALLTLGYPGESPAARPRKAVQDILCRERYS
jgi:nitroreductase